MASFTIQGGAKIEIPQRDEIKTDMAAALAEAQQRDAARGWKWMRLPAILTGTPASSALNIGIATGIVLGPDQGYAWSLRRLVVLGLTTGATPDVVNLQLHGGTAVNQPPLWQFNGNNFGYTFGRLEMVLRPGDRLNLVSVGTITSTSRIVLGGELEEAPAEMLYKLAR